MRSGTRLALALTLAAALAIVAPLPAGACSCVVRSQAEQVRAASTIFIGRVGSTTDTSTTFDVRTVFKGTLSNQVVVSSVEPSGCEVPFTPGRTYLVFAVLSGGTTITNICAGTTVDLSAAAGLATASPSPAAMPRPGGSRLIAESRRVPISVAGALVALLGVATAHAARYARYARSPRAPT